MPVTINASTSSGLVQSADNSGQIELQTNGTTVATVNTSNNVQFRSSISVGNVTPTTSGAGITFPATQSASTDANTLDDYEEGTWTPGIGSFTLNSGTLSFTARYTKIGRQVTITALQETGTITWGTGNYLSGLPFTPSGGTSGAYTNTSLSINGSCLPWNDNFIYFTGSGSSQTRLAFSATYFV